MATTNSTSDQKSGLFKMLDNTFGEEGLKTDVKITLTNETVFKVIATVIGAVGLGTATYFMLRSFFQKRQQAVLPKTPSL